MSNMTAFQPGPPVDASSTTRGLINTLAQVFQGIKTFLGAVVMSAGLKLSIGTAGASEVVFKVGSKLPLGSHASGFKPFQVVANLDGAEVEILSVRPENSGAVYTGVLEFATPPTNKPAINVTGAGAGYSGGISWGTWNGGIYVGPNNGQYAVMQATNVGIQLNTNSDAYLPAGQPSININAQATAGRPGIRVGSVDAGATAQCVSVGTPTADGTVNLGAKLFRVATGLGATEVEKLYVDKAGAWFGGNVNVLGGLLCVNLSGVNWGGYHSAAEMVISGGWLLSNGMSALTVKHGTAFSGGQENTSYLLRLQNGPTLATDTRFLVTANGQIQQNGTDSSGTPGAATIDKPTGKSAIASGATTVVITNSLVAAGDQVFITWHGDLGVQTKVPWVTTAAGSFTVNVGTGPASAVAFCWDVQKRI